MKAGVPVLLALFLCAAPLLSPALEMSQGKIKLTLSEDTGRFSVAYLTSTGSYVPLLSPQDPRTTMLSIVLNTSIFRMGDSAGFALTTEKTPTGARFVWKSDFLTATESFSFISSVESAGADGIRMDLTLSNTSRQDMTAGIRYLFDTWLGENGPTPFATDAAPSITHETTLAGSGLPRWWVSPRAGDSEQLGLQVMVTAEGVTRPDRIVFANWKRLSDASWGYETSGLRDFSLLPYSKNDSAVAQYYDPRPLTAGAELTVTLVLGKYNPNGLPASSPATPEGFAGSLQQSLAAGKTASGLKALRADLEAVNAILSRVDSALAPGGDINESDLSVMESAISDLKARSSAYGK